MGSELDDLRLRIAAIEKQLSEAEREKAEAKDSFFKLFHASSNLMTITSIRDGRIIDLNQAAAALGGFAREELVGKVGTQRQLWADPAQREAIVRKLQEGAGNYNSEVAFLTKDGKQRTVLLYMDPITIDNEPCILGLGIDITAREEEAQALKKSEEKYRLLVENSLQGVAIIQDDRFVFCNSTYARMTGHSVEELLAKSPEQLSRMIHPDDRMIVKNRYQERSEGKPVEPSYEYRGIKKDGSELWLEVYGSLTEFGGKPATQLVFVDITDRKKAEASAKESEEKLKLALEASGMAIWEVNNQTGDVKDEEVWLRRLGYQSGDIDMNLRSVNAFIHPDDLPEIERAAANHLEGKIEHYSVEYRFKARDGSWVWNLDRGKLVSRDAEGRPLRTVGVHLNVTEHKQAIEQIRQLANEQRTILNTISLGICYLKNRKIQWINPAFEKMLGYAADEIRGMDTRMFYAEQNDYQRIRTEGYSQLDKGAIYSSEALLKGKDGSLLWCSLTGQAITADAEEGAIWVLENITERRKIQEALRYSERRFRSLVETTSDLVWEVDKDGIYTYVSPKIKDLLGYDPENVIGRKPFDLMPGDEAGRMEELFRRAAESRQPFAGVLNVNLHRDGRAIVLESSGVPILDAQGNFLGYRGIDRDVTERKQSEEMLRRLNRELRAISDCNQALIRAKDERSLLDEICQIICDKAGYCMVWVGYAENDGTRSVCPVAWAGFENGYLAKISISWADTKSERGPVATVIREGHSVYSQDFMADSGFAPWLEYAIQNGYRSGIFLPLKDENSNTFGVLNIYSAESHAFTTDEIRLLEELAGDLAFGIAVLRARIERERAEEKLKESKEYLSQLLNSLGDPLFVKDREQRYMLVNDAFCAFHDRQRDALLGKTDFDFLPEGLAKTHRERDEEIFVSEKEGTTEDYLPDNRGAFHTFITKKSLLTDKKGNLQMVGVLRDITEYKRLQAQFQQSQKMESIGMLAGGVAHDFNNLLTVIKGYAEVLAEDFDAADPRRQDIDQIIKAGTQAAALTSQLLAFSRKQILQPEIMNLNSVIEQMSSMLRRLIGEDIRLVAKTLPNLGVISADPVQIQQVLLNLAVNARDAMPNGGMLTIETAHLDVDEEFIHAHPATRAGSYIMLAVSDNGIGMDADTQARLFEPFFTTKGKGRGTGLGLATVYGIVKQSNGFIWVYSEPGKGSTFKLCFPRVEAQPAKAVSSDKAGRKLEGFETVLVVEDEGSVRALTRRLLQERGYVVLEASNGNEAIRLAGKYAGTIHMVITDVIMPEMGGRVLVSHLQSVRPDIKVLYVSGYTDNAIVHQGILDSDVAFLQKPFTVERLARKVRDVLDSKP